MVQSHERAHRHRFDGVFRLRPDMLFVTTADVSWVEFALGKDTGMKEERQKELAVCTLTRVYTISRLCGTRPPRLTA
jgi:hypothetical protein